MLREKLRVSTKHDLLMSTLTRFFRQQDNRDRLLRVIKGGTRTSLRLIEWFVTNYCKSRDTVYPLQSPSGKGAVPFVVYDSYKSQLRAYQKQLFDPFCRGTPVLLNYDGEASVKTTVGQLNFFRWLLSNLVLDQLEANLEDVERAFAAHQRQAEALAATKDAQEPAPNALTISATRTVSRHQVSIVVEFN